jgi:hypothetical protein
MENHSQLINHGTGTKGLERGEGDVIIIALFKSRLEIFLFLLFL